MANKCQGISIQDLSKPCYDAKHWVEPVFENEQGQSWFSQAALNFEDQNSCAFEVL